MKEKPYKYDPDDIVCTGNNCPLKETCQRYLPVFDKRKLDHWDIKTPYNPRTGECDYYKHDETDEIINGFNKASSN